MKNLCQQDGTSTIYLNGANARNIMDLIKTYSEYPTTCNNIDPSCVNIIGITYVKVKIFFVRLINKIFVN